MKIKLTDFALKHFERKNKGTKILNITPEQFEIHINNELCYVDDNKKKSVNITNLSESNLKVIDGYAPFCKLVAIPNFTDAKVGSLPITLENYQYLRSGYSSRKDDELPVLSRWLELPLGKPKADWLLIVLYDKNQIDKEAKENYKHALKEFNTRDFPLESEKPIKPESFNADWGIITILGQNSSDEEPMTPITMIRNAYMHGGSGTPIDEEYYKHSVDFWSKNAIVR